MSSVLPGDVIWAGTDEEGFVTSHRAINIGHHTDPWRTGFRRGCAGATWIGICPAWAEGTG